LAEAEQERRPRLDSIAKVQLLPLVCPICDQRYPADFKVCPRDAAKLEDAEGDQDPLVGTVVGEAFRIVRPIGEGGTARVYEARHVRLSSKRFAVKVLHGFFASQANVVARFAREAEAASAVHHPGIVEVHDVDRMADGRPYLVTELLDGEDFGSLLKAKGKVSIPFGVRVARKVCQALSAAHTAGVVHRDLKPENIFLIGPNDKPMVKVLDFGISKIEGAGAAQLTRTGMVVGTPAYMSPEQAAGAKVDARTDIYAVGAILYRALTGRAPFQGGDAAEVLSLVLTAEPPRPMSLEPSIPDALELLIQRAMARSADERFQSMDELDQALGAFGRPRKSRAPSPEPMKEERDTIAPRFTDAPPANPVVIESAAREARMARPSLIGFSLLAFFWTLACLVDALLVVLALSDDAKSQPAAASVIGVTVGVFAALAGPLVLWLRWLGKIWKNTVRAVRLAAITRRVTLSAMVAYAVTALGLSILEDTRVLAPSNAFGTILLTIASLAVAGATYGLSRARRSKVA
jgi:serine/threonine protein kinase